MKTCFARLPAPLREWGRANHFAVLRTAILVGLLLSGGCGRIFPAEATVDRKAFSNGLKVVAIQFPGSTNVSVFTFLPLGLTSDAPGQAQWSHLIEHLVIQSTAPSLREANAETLPDHMRLDFYGNIANWKEGLSHHRRWIEGVPFTHDSLETEKPKVGAECDFTAKNFATHKFAVAAWSHGLRHGKKRIAMKADVLNAKLEPVQQFRDHHLAVSNRVTICVVGGIPPDKIFDEVERELGGIGLNGSMVPPVESPGAEVDLTWDLDARHLIITWPIPDVSHEDHAPLLVAAHWLNFRLNSDSDLKKDTGMVFAGADLATPEGTYFFISASLRPSADFDGVAKALLDHVETLRDPDSRFPLPRGLAGQLSASLTDIPDIDAIKAHAPPSLDVGMIEANAGLQLGMRAHRYGDRLPELASAITAVSPDQIRSVLRRRLSLDSSAVCTIRPAPPR